MVCSSVKKLPFAQKHVCLPYMTGFPTAMCAKKKPILKKDLVHAKK